MPIVLVDRKPDSPEADLTLDLVAEDNTEGASRLTRKREDGHTAIGVVNGPTRSSTGRERLDGVRKAMKECGLNEDPMVYNGDFSTEDGIRAIQHFLARKEANCGYIPE